MAPELKREEGLKSELVEREMREVLEDDAGMRQVTPLPQLREHLVKRFGEEHADQVLTKYQIR